MGCDSEAAQSLERVFVLNLAERLFDVKHGNEHMFDFRPSRC
jgi:hypothetical protein